MLEGGKPVPMARLISTLEVSRPTIRRDLEYMRDRMNCPIVWDRAGRGYRIDDSTGRYELPGLWLSSTEAHALLTMHHLLENLQPKLLAPHVEPLKERVKLLLETSGQSAGEVMDRVRVVPIGTRRVEPKYFELVAHALLSRRRIRIRHYNRERGEETQRNLSPQRLVHYRDNWYLDAWDHDLGALRTFSVEMIRAVEIGDQPARDVPQRMLDDELGSSYGIFAGKPHRTARLRFTPYRARWVAGEIWHPSQKGTFDGEHYVLEVPYSDDRELIQDILRYGPEVEVLGPKSLRRKVAERLRKAVANYEPDGVGGSRGDPLD